jgi:hypothetical protein
MINVGERKEQKYPNQSVKSQQNYRNQHIPLNNNPKCK